jgi:hypothetical protein
MSTGDADKDVAWPSERNDVLKKTNVRKIAKRLGLVTIGDIRNGRPLLDDKGTSLYGDITKLSHTLPQTIEELHFITSKDLDSSIERLVTRHGPVLWNEDVDKSQFFSPGSASDVISLQYTTNRDM